MNLNLQYAERVYNVLLSLYPIRFRVRFAPEMAQVFRDCCHDALEKGEVAILAAFLVSALRDLLVSILRERRSELMGPLNIDHPIVGIIDLTLIPSIVTVNLVVLGPVLTLLVCGGVMMPMEQFVMTSGFFSVAIGGLAVVTSLVITKLRPTVRLWVKLSA
jgi:hypothetical protein